MRGGERNVPRRMPILRQHHVLEPLGNRIDQRDDLVALADRQTTARNKAVLVSTYTRSVRHQVTFFAILD